MEDQKKDPKECVLDLIRKADKVIDAGDAMKISQAALNAANALLTMRDVK